MIRALHNAFGWLAAFIFTALLGMAAMFAGTFSQHSNLALNIARLWGRLCLLVTGIRLSVEGLEKIDLDRNYVVLANHESTIDIPTLLVALPTRLGVRFLAKKSLFSVPFLGRGMRAIRFIPVDREDRSTAREMFEQTLEQLRLGHSVLIFPEATRTKDGHLLPFHRGGFLMALKSGAPILPVGLEGPRLCMPDGTVWFRPGKIVVRFGEAIGTSDLGISQRRELTNRVRASIDSLRGDRGHIHDAPID